MAACRRFIYLCISQIHLRYDSYQFKALDENEQYETLWDNGIFITHRKEAGYTFALYQINAFYVELKYDAGMNKILGVRSFISVNQLEPYLKYIELPNFD
jgi:hypothetical protein